MFCMMRLWTGLSVVCIVFVVVGTVRSETTEACVGEKYNSCACKTKSGWINLAPLDQAKTNGNPKFSDIEGSQYYDKINYNPCTAFSESDSSECSEVAGCQITDYGYGSIYYYSMGTQDSATFSESSGDVLLTYSGGTKKTQITLVCTPTSEGDLEFKNNRNNVYKITLNTKYACASIAPPPGGESGAGLSPGSIMLIIFFSVLFVYLVVGILINHFMKGARGAELIPNVQFWVAIPGYVKDGTVYTVNSGKRFVQSKTGGGDKMYETVK